MPTTRPAGPAAPVLSAILAATLTLLTGCHTGDGTRSFVFAASEYPAALDATRETLRAAGYTLERVDAVRGEILTDHKALAGFITPFEPENNSPVQAWRDTLNYQPRTVRVRFRDADSVERGEPTPPEPGADIHAEVEVIVWRQRRPGRRLETETIRLSSVSRDPILTARGVTYGMLVPLRRDDAFAAELAHKLRRSIEEQAEPTPETTDNG